MTERTIILLFVLIGLASGQERATLAPEVNGQKNAKFDKFNQFHWEAYLAFDKERRDVEAAYRGRTAEAFQLVDRAEILLLDFEVTPRPGGGDLRPSIKFYGDEVEGFGRDTHLYIPNYDSYSKILKRNEIKGEKMKPLVEAVVVLLKEPAMSPGPMCHYPIHGVRLFLEDEQLFETSLCWHCGNYFLRMPSAWGGMWVSFKGEKLEAFLKKEMPIPQSELDRFDAKYGSKQKKAME